MNVASGHAGKHKKPVRIYIFSEQRHTVPDFKLTKPHTTKVYKVLKNSMDDKLLAEGLVFMFVYT
jgi:hypothetical protein